MVRLFEQDESIVKERSKRAEGRPYRSSTPMTPIPRRASAVAPEAVRARSRYSSVEVREGDGTYLPTVAPPTLRQDEEVEYESERHRSLHPVEEVEYSAFLPSSLSIDELDTLPPRGERFSDELDTVPPGGKRFSNERLCEKQSSLDAMVEADTVMDDTLIVVSSLPSAIDKYPIQVEDAVDVALTVRARELLRHNHSPDTRPAFIHNPLDYVRWWLLGSGHLEFLFWLGGAVLLSVILCVVLIMTGMGLGWMSLGHLGH